MERPGIPLRMPVRFSDRINLSMGAVFVPEIHLRLFFEGPLDRSRLARALRLLLDAEPVLGCRFVSHWRKPWWERLPAEELDRAVLVSEAEGEEAEAAFLARRIPVEKGPQICGLILPDGEGERLVLKVHHATCDAGGLKALALRLAGIYRALEEDPGHRPEPNTGSRSLRQVYGRFSLRVLLAVFWRGMKELWRGISPFKSTQMPSEWETRQPPTFHYMRFDREEAGRILRAGRPYSATANDLFVAAVLRALKKTAGRDGNRALRLAGTVDMRRYLPGRRADALCQISGLYTVCLKDPGPDFARTLRQVCAQTGEQKSRHFGLGLILFLYAQFGPWPWFAYRRFVPAFWRLGARDGNIPPGFTNLGPLPMLDFGGPGLGSAEMVVPGAVPPFFFSGVSGFAGSFCVSAGFHPDAVPPERVDAYLAAIREELLGFAAACGE